jgi:4-hydroxy-tetrahydrodipicolinate synthase
MREPGQLITAMATPFAPDGSLDKDGAGVLARHLLSQGTEAIVICGTTGESPVLSHDEKLELLDTVRQAVGAQAPIYIGTGTNSTAGSISLTREAEEHGADGVLLVAPYYNRPPQSGLYQHFAAIASSTSLPAMLYNIPSRTGVDILPETIIQLSEAPNIFAVKEASGQVTRTAEILARAQPGFRVYSGDDSLLLPMMSLGACGIVSVASHVAGMRLRSLIDAYLAGQVQQAASIHQSLIPLFKALFITTNPIPLKSALKLMGLPAGSPRLPLVDATPAETAAVRHAMESLGLLG